jgi:hypothetical protein
MVTAKDVLNLLFAEKQFRALDRGSFVRSSAIPLLFSLPLGEGEGEGGKLLHIIAVAHPIVPEDVTVVSEF